MPNIVMASAENAIPMVDADREGAIVMTVLRDGRVFLGSDQIAVSDLGPRARDLLANKVDKEVYLRADTRANFRAVEDVVDSLRAADIDDFGLIIGLLVQKKSPNGQSYMNLPTVPKGLELVVPPIPGSKQHPVQEPKSAMKIPPPPPPPTIPRPGKIPRSSRFCISHPALRRIGSTESMCRRSNCCPS